LTGPGDNGFQLPAAWWLLELCNKNPKKEPHMANRNTNPGSGKDDNEMRIQFGMILSSLRRRRINENMVWTDSQDYGATMYLSTENVKKSLLWLSPPVLKWFLSETDLSTLLRG
jgi:hypothetical protein